ncbi:hypothetical protein CYMTET_32905, partial [Cymbomonas tetramitiformis]
MRGLRRVRPISWAAEGASICGLRRAMNEGEREEGFSAAMQCILALGPYGLQLQDRHVRQSLVDTLASLAGHNPGLAAVLPLIQDLNSWDVNDVDGMDYDKRLSGFRSATPVFFSGLTRTQASLVLWQMMHHTKMDDMALRGSSVAALSCFMEAVALEPKASAPLAIMETGARPLAEATSELRPLVRGLIFPVVTTALKHEMLYVRSEHLEVLRRLGQTLPEMFPELQQLLDKDPEVDFFYNVTHVQMHRRVRALRKLQKVCLEKALSRGVLMSVFVPLLSSIVVEIQTNDKKSTDTQANLVEMAVQGLAAAAGCLPWAPYFQILTKYLRMIKSKPEYSKVATHIVCGLIDSFHFFEKKKPAAEADAVMREEADGAVMREEANDAGDKQDATIDGEAKEDEGEMEAEDEVVEDEPQEEKGEGENFPETELAEGDNALGLEVPAAILAVLRKKLLPELGDHVIEEQEVVRAPMALAVVKVLKLLPTGAVAVELPRVLGGVCNLLRTTNPVIRESARKTLSEMAAELGPKSLSIIVQVMTTALTR